MNTSDNVAVLVKDEIYSFLASEFGLTPDKVYPSARIGDDLGMDSLDKAIFLIHLEDKFEIELRYDLNDEPTLEEIQRKVVEGMNK
jgi:acyl carrier protein